MANRPPDFQVLVSYKDLCTLLDAAKKVDDLSRKQKRLELQFEKLNERFLELMIAFGDLKRWVSD